jgi:phage terminase Nu1 subunit (DNA packaging protein)
MPDDKFTAENIEKILAVGPLAVVKAYQAILKKIKEGRILTPTEVKSLGLLEKKMQSGADRRDENSTIVNSLERVAQHFDKSLRQVQRWAKQGMPGLSGGRFDLMQIEDWRRIKKGGRGPAVGSDPRNHGQPGLIHEGDKHYWDMRQKRAQAQQRELDLHQKQKKLMNLAEVEALLAPRAMAYRQGILAMQTLAPEIGLKYGLPPEAVRAIAEMIASRGREILANMLRPVVLIDGPVLAWNSEGPELTQGGA